MADQTQQQNSQPNGQDKKKGRQDNGPPLGVYIKPPENKPMVTVGTKEGHFNISFRIKLTRKSDQPVAVRVFIQSRRIDVVEIKDILDINFPDCKVDTTAPKEIRVETVTNPNQKDAMEFSLPETSQATASTPAPKKQERLRARTALQGKANSVTAETFSESGEPEDSEVVIRCSRPFTIDGQAKPAGEERLRRTGTGRYASQVTVDENFIAFIYDPNTGTTLQRWLLKE